MQVLSYHTAVEKFKEGTELTECVGNLKFCDISADFSYIISGNERFALLRSAVAGAKKKLMVFKNEAKVFKFNNEGTRLAVGFAEGHFNVSTINDCLFFSHPSNRL